MSDDIVITPSGLSEEWCDFCLVHKWQEFRKFCNSHHYEGKKLVLHVQIGHLCLDCGTFNPIDELKGGENVR